jgi:hypothetical protein
VAGHIRTAPHFCVDNELSRQSESRRDNRLACLIWGEFITGSLKLRRSRSFEYKNIHVWDLLQNNYILNYFYKENEIPLN